MLNLSLALGFRGVVAIYLFRSLKNCVLVIQISVSVLKRYDFDLNLEV